MKRFPRHQEPSLLLMMLLASAACGPSVPGGDADYYDEGPRQSGEKPALEKEIVLPDIEVTVGTDGSFSPQHVEVADGQAVKWNLNTWKNGIIPSTSNTGAWPTVCTQVRNYSTTHYNEFTGPMPKAASGVFVLSPWNKGYEEVATVINGLCASGAIPWPLNPVHPTIEPFLCEKDWAAFKQKTMDATWAHLDFKGVFIRLKWSDINPSMGVYDFTILDRELAQAVTHNKLYSLAIRAGQDGTPDWIFTTNPPVSFRRQPKLAPTDVQKHYYIHANKCSTLNTAFGSVTVRPPPVTPP